MVKCFRHETKSRGENLRKTAPILFLVWAASFAQASPQFNANELAGKGSQWFTCDLDGDGLKDLVLIDGLTLWASLALGDDPTRLDTVLDGDVADVLSAIVDHDGPVVVVSDEVGLGLVPLDPVGRAFRDLLGIAHQRLVAASDEAWFMVAGRAIRLAGANPGAGA